MKRLRPIAIRRHGTTTSYNLGCRCDLCVSVTKAYWANYFGAEEKLRLRKERWFLSQYDLTIGDADRILESQGGCCKLCQKPLAPKFGGKGNRNHVDHKHGTKIVRGILDERCNKGLGYFDDDPALLERAARYTRTDGRFDDWQPGIGAGLV